VLENHDVSEQEVVNNYTRNINNTPVETNISPYSESVNVQNNNFIKDSNLDSKIS